MALFEKAANDRLKAGDLASLQAAMESGCSLKEALAAYASTLGEQEVWDAWLEQKVNETAEWLRGNSANRPRAV